VQVQVQALVLVQAQVQALVLVLVQARWPRWCCHLRSLAGSGLRRSRGRSSARHGARVHRAWLSPVFEWVPGTGCRWLARFRESFSTDRPVGRSRTWRGYRSRYSACKKRVLGTNTYDSGC